MPSLLPELGVRLAALRVRAPGDTVTERMMLAALSRVACHRGDSAEHAAELAERALTGGVAPEGAEAVSRFTALFTLIDADRLDAAEEQLDATMVVSRWRGSLLGYASVVGCQALVAYQRGDVSRAVTDAVTALQSGSLHGALVPIVMACLVRARLARRRRRAAPPRSMAPLGDFELPDIVVFNHALVARAQVRFALGDVDAALEDMRLALERVPRAVRLLARAAVARRWPCRCCSRPGATDEAAAVAADDVAGARSWGTPGAIGARAASRRRCALARRSARPLAARGDRAARGVARAAGPRGGVAGARRDDDRARRVDEASSSSGTGSRSRRLRRARAGRTRSARPPAAGARSCARPRAEPTLTPSERRVADLAGQGYSEREIAEALFITAKAVEDELDDVHAKLGPRAG